MVDDDTDYHAVLERVSTLLTQDYGIARTAIQCEPVGHADHHTVQ